jgi:hypothetical protein
MHGVEPWPIDAEDSRNSAGDYVREEIHHVRAGKHGARSAKQAIAIGLSKARRAGVKLPAPKPGTTSAAVRERAQRELRSAGKPRNTSPRRSRAMMRKLQREGSEAASPLALAAGETAARRRSAKARSASARKAARTRVRPGTSRRKRA